MKTQTFSERVYEALCNVPKGKVTTYKELGKALHTKAYRAIGQALRRNPSAPEVPCHRVVASDGRIGGYMGARKGESIEKKIVLLRNEGVEVAGRRIANFDTVLFSF